MEIASINDDITRAPPMKKAFNASPEKGIHEFELQDDPEAPFSLDENEFQMIHRQQYDLKNKPNINFYRYKHKPEKRVKL